MTTSSLPIIDISRFDGPAAPVVEQVRRTCEDTGFFLLAGHGVSDDLVARTYDTMRRFFDQDATVKRGVARPLQGVSRGYNALADQSLAYSFGQKAPPDLQESFAIGPLVSPPADLPAEAVTHFAPNIWPATPADLQPTIVAYYHAMEALAARIMRLFAAALRVPEDFFADKIDRHISVMRMINYPEQPRDPEPGQLRAGAHTDWGTVTILRIDGAAGGLQIQRQDGSWLDVQAVPGTYVINIGDLMARWTNDRWRSTIHRVVNPPRAAQGRARRISLVFFHQPNHDAEVRGLESCIDAAHPAKYPPVTSGEHWRAKLKATREMKKEYA